MKRSNRVGTRDIENLVAPLKTVEVRKREIQQLQTGPGRAVEHDHTFSSSGAQVRALHPLIVSSDEGRGFIA